MTKFERLDSTGSGSSLNGEDITKPFLIGVAGGTASGKVRYIILPEKCEIRAKLHKWRPI